MKYWDISHKKQNRKKTSHKESEEFNNNIHHGNEDETKKQIFQHDRKWALNLKTLLQKEVEFLVLKKKKSSWFSVLEFFNDLTQFSKILEEPWFI